MLPTLTALKVCCHFLGVKLLMIDNSSNDEHSGCVQLWNDIVGDIPRHWGRAIPIKWLFDCSKSEKQRFVPA